MRTRLTSKGQVTIPKQIRDALNLEAGAAIEFSVNGEGKVVLQKVLGKARARKTRDRFEAARGKAEIKWRTDELMALLRPDDG